MNTKIVIEVKTNEKNPKYQMIRQLDGEEIEENGTNEIHKDFHQGVLEALKMYVESDDFLDCTMEHMDSENQLPGGTNFTQHLGLKIKVRKSR